MVLRNNIFVHLSPKQAIGMKNFVEEYPLNEAEIWELIDRGLQIVNRYSTVRYVRQRPMPPTS